MIIIFKLFHIHKRFYKILGNYRYKKRIILSIKEKDMF